MDWKIFLVIFTKLIPRKNFLCIAKLLVLMVIQNKKTSVTVSVTFRLIIPSNYELVTFWQFEEGGGRTPTGPSETVTFTNSKKIGNGIGNFLTN